MTRAEELTGKFVDGTATTEERAELNRLAESDPAALRVHLLAMEIEGLLLAEGPSADLRTPVLDGIDRIEKARESRILGALMPRLRAYRPGPPIPRWRRAHVLVPAGLSAVAMVAAILIGAGLRWGQPAAHLSGKSEPSNVVPPLMTIAVRGSVSLIRGGAIAPLLAGMVIEPGDAVETGAGAEAHLARAGRTDLLLGTDSTLAVDVPPVDGALLGDVVRLDRGRLDATVAAPSDRQSLSLRTPHAWATAAGTRLSVLVDGRQTRLDVKEGRVTFRRLQDLRSIEVTAGRQALAVEQTGGQDDAPVGVESKGAEPAVVLAFDFENGVLEADLEDGHLVRGAPCPDGGTCVQAALSPALPQPRFGVTLSRRSSDGVLFSYNEKQVLTFDYWMAVGGQWQTVNIWNRDQKQNYALYLFDLAVGRWGHAVVRLSDLRPEAFRDRRLDNGDAISSLFVLVGPDAGGKPLYVDNIRIAESSTGPLPKSGGRPPDPVVPCLKTPIHVAAAILERGYCWLVPGQFGGRADSRSNAARSALRLFENDRELGPAHSIHVDIQDFGQGRFSHYGQNDGSNESIRLSASDNSDPRVNGRRYSYCAPGASEATGR